MTGSAILTTLFGLVALVVLSPALVTIGLVIFWKPGDHTRRPTVFGFPVVMRGSQAKEQKQAIQKPPEHGI